MAVQLFGARLWALLWCVHLQCPFIYGPTIRATTNATTHHTASPMQTHPRISTVPSWAGMPVTPRPVKRRL